MEIKDILMEIQRRIRDREKEMELTSNDFSERDALGKVWTKKNSKWNSLLVEVAELEDLKRFILFKLNSPSKPKTNQENKK